MKTNKQKTTIFFISILTSLSMAIPVHAYSNPLVNFRDTVFMQNGNLVIKYSNDDQITVLGQSNAANQIERFEIGSNLYMTNIDINNLIQDMSAYAVENGILMTNVDDVRNNAGLMQLVANSWNS